MKRKKAVKETMTSKMKDEICRYRRLRLPIEYRTAVNKSNFPRSLKRQKLQIDKMMKARLE